MVADFPPELFASVSRYNFARKGNQAVEVLDAITRAYGYDRNIVTAASRTDLP